MVSDKLFAHIVNSNLEVRTSVAIDPATGAAQDEALFTYEAIPRMTVMSWSVTARNPRHFIMGKQTNAWGDTTKQVLEVVESGEAYLEHLGIGGMGSRGMGRMQVVCRQGGQEND